MRDGGKLTSRVPVSLLRNVSTAYSCGHDSGQGSQWLFRTTALLVSSALLSCPLALFVHILGPRKGQVVWSLQWSESAQSTPPWPPGQRNDGVMLRENETSPSTFKYIITKKCKPLPSSPATGRHGLSVKNGRVRMPTSHSTW